MNILRLVILCIKLWKMFLNGVFTLIIFLIYFGLNPALALVYLFIYILFVCLFTYFISIISWSLKLEQITPPCWLYHTYFKVSNILYYASLSYSTYAHNLCKYCSSNHILKILKLYFQFKISFL